jgi:hypothetical protein
VPARDGEQVALKPGRGSEAAVELDRLAATASRLITSNTRLSFKAVKVSPAA